MSRSWTNVPCTSPCFGANGTPGSSGDRSPTAARCRSRHPAMPRSDEGVIPAGTPGMEGALPLCAPAAWGREDGRVRIYLHRLARSRSSAHLPCRYGSGRPPAGSRAGRCSRSGNPSARRPSTRRSPAAPPAARGTGFLGCREQKGEGSGCPAMPVGRAPRTGHRGCRQGDGWGTLTSAVRHPGPVAAGQALDGAGSHQPVPAGAAQLAACPQAAAVGAAPGRVAGGLSAVDVERGTPLGHWGRGGR